MWTESKSKSISCFLVLPSFATLCQQFLFKVCLASHCSLKHPTHCSSSCVALLFGVFLGHTLSGKFSRVRSVGSCQLPKQKINAKYSSDTRAEVGGRHVHDPFDRGISFLWNYPSPSPCVGSFYDLYKRLGEILPAWWEWWEASLGTFPWAGQETEGCCPCPYSCWICHEAAKTCQLPLSQHKNWMCWAGGTICEGRKGIQPRSFRPGCPKCPIAFYGSAIGCGVAPAWSCGRRGHVPGRKHPETMEFTAHVCSLLVAGLETATWVMSPRCSLRSPPLTWRAIRAESSESFPRDKINKGPPRLCSRFMYWSLRSTVLSLQFEMERQSLPQSPR